MKKVSDKHLKQLEQYRLLREKLYQLSDGRSELSGKHPTYSHSLCGYVCESHHIDGRDGERLVNAFGIILVTSDEHAFIHANPLIHSKEELYKLVKPIRIKQGFEES